MAWTDLSYAFAYGSILTAAQLQHLYGNISEACAGAAGAPTAVESALRAQSVTSAALATSLSGMLVTSGNTHDHALAGQTKINTVDLSPNAIKFANVTNSYAFVGSYVTLTAGQETVGALPSPGLYGFTVESGTATTTNRRIMVKLTNSVGSLVGYIGVGQTQMCLVTSNHSIVNSTTGTVVVRYWRLQ